MFKRLILLLSSLVMASSSFAQSDLSLPEELQMYKDGYPQAPIIQCPKPSKKFEEMLSQLDGIKQQIKSEACPDSKIAAIKKEVSSLEELLLKGQGSFIDLVKKGSVEGGQLTSKEVDTLKDYIDQVVKKTAQVTGLVNNPACFDEDEKVSTLSTLSSIVGEVAGVIGALAGPFGAKISLGGKLAAGLLGSIDTIVQARKTYEYDKYEDRRNYLNNLCAYYQFKGDIDKEANVLGYVDRLWAVKDSANDLLKELYKQCPECRRAIDDYSARLNRSVGFKVSKGLAELDKFDVVINSTSKQNGMIDVLVKPEDMTFDQLRDVYFPGTFDDEPDLDQPVVVNPYQEQTILALQTRAWADQEIADLEANDEEGIAEEGRREVLRVQGEIEDFLVAREGRRYVDHHSSQLKEDQRELAKTAQTIMFRLYQMRPLPDPNYDYKADESDIASVFHDMFRENMEYSSLVEGYWEDEDLKEFRRKSQELLKNGLEKVRLDYSILEQRCLFFEESNYDFVAPVEYACGRGRRQLDDTKQEILALRNTSFNKRYSFFLKFIDSQEKNWTADWMDSVTSVLTMSLAEL